MGRSSRHALRPASEALEPRTLLTTLPAGFVEAPVVEGLDRPTAMELAPDGRIFVAEQGGALRVVRDGQLLPSPFLDLAVDSRGERGLLGVAFDPQFASNGFVYVYYTVPGTPAHNRVSRFTAAGDAAVPGSEVPILDLEPLTDATNHNGGAIHFGADGALYVGVGENARADLSQALDTRLGKLLRIGPDGSIPPDNPFVGQAAGANRAIWALGLRNPFTFAFQPGTGRLFLNDVGANGFEEINDGAAGANYGWPTTEGPTSDPRFRSPLYSYRHDETVPASCAIAGGVFYNPTSPQFPAEMVGDYFFADLCGRFIKRIDPDSRAVADFAADLPGSPVDLDVAPSGALYALVRGPGDASGRVLRIDATTPPDLQAPVISRQPEDRFAASGGSAAFSVEAVGTGPFSYQWQRDGVDIAGATGPELTIASVHPADSGARFRVLVSNASGQVVSREAVLAVESPLVHALYADILGRPADPIGLVLGSLFLARGGSATVLAQALIDSPEARAREVALAYQRLLGRPPSPSETAAGVAGLASGGRREDLLAGLLGSREYLARSGGTARGFAAALFRDVLGRTPTRRELARLGVGLADRARARLAARLLSGDEYRGRLVASWYTSFARRPASPAEVSFWVARLRDGLRDEQALAQFFTSPAYLGRVGA